MAPLSTAEALAVIAGGTDPESVGVAAGRPILSVALDDRDAGYELVRAIGTQPCVTVGIADQPVPRPPSFDVLLCAQDNPPAPWIGAASGWDGLLQALAAAVARNPDAATALAQLLRITGELSVEAALVAESFAYSMLQAGPELARWLAHQPAIQRHRHESEPVRIARSDDALIITLCRPHVRNAVNAAMRDALVEALVFACSDPTVAAVHLAAEGPDFCSGGDLDEFGTGADPVTNHAVRVTRSPARWLGRCAARAAAHVHGRCIGAGIELSALCAELSAEPETTFRLPEIGMGLIPGAGGTVSIPRRIGRERMAWLAITGTSLDAETALKWGLIDHIASSIGPRPRH